jgi:hypothetical protein
MAVTQLKRKDRVNKATFNNNINKVKQLMTRPTIKKVDIDAIKASFTTNA